MQTQKNQKNIRLRSQISNKGKLIKFIKEFEEKRQQEKIHRKKKKLVGFSSGQWNLRQTKLYVRYLSSHKLEFTDPQLRKRNKVFIKLADFIGSRTPDQCRSHHQKATRRFTQFEELVGHYQKRIDQQTKILKNEKELADKNMMEIESEKYIEKQVQKIQEISVQRQIQNYQYQDSLDVEFIKKPQILYKQNQIIMQKKQQKTKEYKSQKFYQISYNTQKQTMSISINLADMKQYMQS